MFSFSHRGKRRCDNAAKTLSDMRPSLITAHAEARGAIDVNVDMVLANFAAMLRPDAAAGACGAGGDAEGARRGIKSSAEGARRVEFVVRYRM